MFLLVELAIGVVVGGIAHLAVRGRNRLTWSETVIAGIVGAGIGGSLFGFLDGRDFGPSLLAAITAIGCAVVLVLVASWIKGAVSSAPERVATADLLDAGESTDAEFKSSARWNVREARRDERIELVIVKTVAAFMNTRGGTLLIGVDDAAQPLGLENDLATMKSHDLDRYELWLNDLFDSCLGRAALSGVVIGFPEVAGTTICRIDVRPSERPVFVNRPKSARTADFFIRVGNSTRQLLNDEIIDYYPRRWGGVGLHPWRRVGFAPTKSG